MKKNIFAILFLVGFLAMPALGQQQVTLDTVVVTVTPPDSDLALPQNAPKALVNLKEQIVSKQKSLDEKRVKLNEMISSAEFGEASINDEALEKLLSEIEGNTVEVENSEGLFSIEKDDFLVSELDAKSNASAFAH